jgi:hypothetical protein
MKARATTLTIGIGMTLALIAPATQAAVIWGGGAAATPSTPTIKANTNHRATKPPGHPHDRPRPQLPGPQGAHLTTTSARASGRHPTRHAVTLTAPAAITRTQPPRDSLQRRAARNRLNRRPEAGWPSEGAGKRRPIGLPRLRRTPSNQGHQQYPHPRFLGRALLHGPGSLIFYPSSRLTGEEIAPPKPDDPWFETWRIDAPSRKAPTLARYLAERDARGENLKRCAWDGTPIPPGRRADTQFCADRCRRAAARLGGPTR